MNIQVTSSEFWQQNVKAVSEYATRNEKNKLIYHFDITFKTHQAAQKFLLQGGLPRFRTDPSARLLDGMTTIYFEGDEAIRGYVRQDFCDSMGETFYYDLLKLDLGPRYWSEKLAGVGSYIVTAGDHEAECLNLVFDKKEDLDSFCHFFRPKLLSLCKQFGSKIAIQMMGAEPDRKTISFRITPQSKEMSERLQDTLAPLFGPPLFKELLLAGPDGWEEVRTKHREMFDPPIDKNRNGKSS